MSNTKRDKYDEVALEIAILFGTDNGGIESDALLKVASILRSAFPPPAEDAKALAISLCDIYDPPYMRKDFAIQRADAEIESFAESRVEPWREALQAIADGRPTILPRFEGAYRLTDAQATARAALERKE